MKIIIVSVADVADIIGVTLMDRGHVIEWTQGYAGEEVMQDFADADGCLVIGDSAGGDELARRFRDHGKMVWREWTDNIRRRNGRTVAS